MTPFDDSYDNRDNTPREAGAAALTADPPDYQLAQVCATLLVAEEIGGLVHRLNVFIDVQDRMLTYVGDIATELSQIRGSLG
jgi:hypothetical protein